MSYIDLIYDRTQADVDEVAALKAQIYAGTISTEDLNRYKAGLKGAYNATDVNRVGQACKDIADLFEEFGIEISVNPVTTFTHTSTMSRAQEARYLQDVMTVKNASAVPTGDIPQTLDFLTYEGANAIEKCLYDVWSAYDVSQQGKQRLAFKLNTKKFGI